MRAAPALLVCALLAGCDAAPPAPPTAAVDDPASRVFTAVQPPVMLETAGPGNHEFVIPVVNRSAEAVRFGEASCACVCSRTKLAKTELAPGEEMLVRMSVMPATNRRRESFTCRWTDDKGRGWEATAVAEFCARAQFEEWTRLLHNVQAGEERTVSLKYVEHAASESELPAAPAFRVDGALARLTAGRPATEAVQPGLVRRTTAVEVAVTIPETVGEFTAYVRPDPPPAGVLNEVRGEVRWYHRPAVEVAPSRAVFVLSPGAPLARPLRLRSADGSAFTVTKVSCEVPSVSAKVMSSDGATATVEVSVAPSGVTGLTSGEVVVEPTHPGAHRLRIPVAVLPAPKTSTADGKPSVAN